MSEFKYSPSNDTYYYIESNPRIGMCNWFDTCCGINNVAAACALAQDQPWPAGLRQSDGVIFWNVIADFVARLESRESPVSIVRRYWRLRTRQKVWPVFDVRDPAPWLFGLRKAVVELGGRALRYPWRRRSDRVSGGRP